MNDLSVEYNDQFVGYFVIICVFFSAQLSSVAMADPKALEVETITAEAWVEWHQNNRFCFTVEGRGGEERSSSRTRTGASS